MLLVLLWFCDIAMFALFKFQVAFYVVIVVIVIVIVIVIVAATAVVVVGLYSICAAEAGVLRTQNQFSLVGAKGIKGSLFLKRG